MAKRKPKPGTGKVQMGFSRAEVAAAKEAQSRSEGSTPRAIVDAFAPERAAIAGFELEPCYGSTIILLTRIGSTLLKTDRSAEFLLEDLFRALVIFTRPIAAARELVKRGRLDTEAEAIADIFPPAYIKPLAERLNARIVEGFSTLVPHGSKGEGEGSGNFPDPKAAAPATAGS